MTIEEQRSISELLAIMHGDGGHHEDAVGTERAIKDAIGLLHTKWINAHWLRSEKLTLLESYSEFLEENGYMDIDWRAEEPFAIDEFMKTQSS